MALKPTIRIKDWLLSTYSETRLRNSQQTRKTKPIHWKKGKTNLTQSSGDDGLDDGSSFLVE